MLTCQYIPEAWAASELKRAPVSPLIAFCGASPEDELVFDVATQPVWLRGVSVDAGTARTMPPRVTAATMSRRARRAARGGDGVRVMQAPRVNLRLELTRMIRSDTLLTSPKLSFALHVFLSRRRDPPLWRPSRRRGSAPSGGWRRRAPPRPCP